MLIPHGHFYLLAINLSKMGRIGSIQSRLWHRSDHLSVVFDTYWSTINTVHSMSIWLEENENTE